MKKVLLLGAGLVARPMVEYLLDKGYRLLIASPMKERADEMIGGHKSGSSVYWSMTDRKTLEKLVADSDITVSLLPSKFHLDVASVCLRQKKNLVTTSYAQPQMTELDSAARDAGILFLNEMGLDPGIDHMTAMKIIDYVHFNGGKVEGLYSLCGALPAPEAADNPMKYKFTWSPKGVILACMNSALYLKNGKETYIDSENLFSNRFRYNFPPIGELEVYPNRDSIIYIDIYGISETRTMYRGTFRYAGWCETLNAMKSLNMFDNRVSDYGGMTYADFLARSAGTGREKLKSNISAKLGITESATAIQSLSFLGFFDDDKLPCTEASAFDITSDRMIERMMAKNDDRDMVLLRHIILATYPNGSKEVIRLTLTDFGTPATNTATSRTVALPAAIAVRLILEDKIRLSGAYRPVVPQIYLPVLNELKSLGIEINEEFSLPENEFEI
jgi:saccharopine dehydrogenase (NADP+, L-glutamate forming)